MNIISTVLAHEAKQQPQQQAANYNKLVRQRTEREQGERMILKRIRQAYTMNIRKNPGILALT